MFTRDFKFVAGTRRYVRLGLAAAAPLAVTSLRRVRLRHPGHGGTMAGRSVTVTVTVPLTVPVDRDLRVRGHESVTLSGNPASRSR